MKSGNSFHALGSNGTPRRTVANWPIRRLGDVTTISSGITLGRNLEGRACRPVHYLTVQNVKDGYLDLTDFRQTLATEVEISDCRLELGDILLTEGGDRDKLGRGTYWRGEVPECIHQNHIFRVRSHPQEFDPAFLAFQFGSPYGKTYFLLHAKQTTGIATINKAVLSDFPLLTPPLAEQRRVAAQLAEQLEMASKARSAITVTERELARLSDAIIANSIQSTQTSRQRLGDVLVEVCDGVGASWSNFPVLGATRSGLAPAREAPGKNPGRYKPVFAGTVFYNPMRILIGSIAFVDGDDQPGITSPDYVVLKGKAGGVDSRWFYYWLRSPWGERCIQSLARGAVRERMLFTRLAEGDIELPDYDTQLRASQALAQIKPMRKSIQIQSQELDLLPQKLLAQVFGS